MNIYIWLRIEHASSSYHSAGGVVVIADTLEEAVALAKVQGATIAPSEKPDHIFELDQSQEKMAIVFPDAGCC
jgi:hypothetical protein